jgi:hypothetical protein
MKTLWQEEARQELIGRLTRLTPANKASWGKMDSNEMLAHLVNSLQMSIGELKVAAKPSPLRLALLRYLIIYWIPFPKNVPTANELIGKNRNDWEKVHAELSRLIQRYRELENKKDWPEHPVFGKMTSEDWGAICYKHIDHHFKQFGI